MSVFELPLVAHPDFAIPGVKPKGEVEIDWNHPLTQGLVACWINTSRNLVTDKPPGATTYVDKVGQSMIWQ